MQIRDMLKCMERTKRKMSVLLTIFLDKWPLNKKINSAVAIHFVVICHNNVKHDTLNSEGLGNVKKDGSVFDI